MSDNKPTIDGEEVNLEAWLINNMHEDDYGQQACRELAALYESRLSAMAKELEQAKDLLGGLVDSGGALRQENQSLRDQLESLKTERTRLEGSAVETVRRVAAERDEALKELEAAKSSAALWMKTAERLDKALGPPAASDTPAAVCACGHRGPLCKEPFKRHPNIIGGGGHCYNAIPDTWCGHSRACHGSQA